MKKVLAWVAKHWFKLAFLAICLLGLFQYQDYKSEQNFKEGMANLEKKEIAEKQFDAEQKKMCLDIYKQESVKFNNVSGWSYVEYDDNCKIEYKEAVKKTHAQCDALYKGDDGKVSTIFFTDWLYCYDGLFVKSF
jgi:hypothetical protein